jgi:hypothetical protein
MRAIDQRACCVRLFANQTWFSFTGLYCHARFPSFYCYPLQLHSFGEHPTSNARTSREHRRFSSLSPFLSLGVRVSADLCFFHTAGFPVTVAGFGTGDEEMRADFEFPPFQLLSVPPRGTVPSVPTGRGQASSSIRHRPQFH